MENSTQRLPQRFVHYKFRKIATVYNQKANLDMKWVTQSKSIGKMHPKHGSYRGTNVGRKPF